jgi:hypothetical protein
LADVMERTTVGEELIEGSGEVSLSFVLILCAQIKLSQQLLYKWLAVFNLLAKLLGDKIKEHVRIHILVNE